MHRATLLLAAACLSQAAGAQQAAPVATPDRDGASVFIAQLDYLVSRVASECVAVVGRAEAPQAFTSAWRQRNARYFSASTRYIDRRAQEAAAAAGEAQAQALREAFRKAVQDASDQQVRALLQDRRADGCMYGMTLIDTGALDIDRKLPEFDKLEALTRWAEQ